MKLVRKSHVIPNATQVLSKKISDEREHDKGVVKGPNAEPAPQQEMANADSASPLEFLPQLGADQQSAENEEQINACPAPAE